MHLFVAALQSVTDSCIWRSRTALGCVLDALFLSFCMVPRTEDMFLTPSAVSPFRRLQWGSGLVHYISSPADTWIPTACWHLGGVLWLVLSTEMRMEVISTVSGWPSKCLEIPVAVGQMRGILGMILRSQQIKEPFIWMDERSLAPWLITWKAVWTQQEGHEENAKLLCKAADIWGLFVMEASSNPSN